MFYRYNYKSYSQKILRSYIRFVIFVFNSTIYVRLLIERGCIDSTSSFIDTESCLEIEVNCTCMSYFHDIKVFMRYFCFKSCLYTIKVLYLLERKQCHVINFSFFLHMTHLSVINALWESISNYNIMCISLRVLCINHSI